MTRTFKLDPHAAKDANTGGKRITDPGEYTGKFRAAWHEVNDKGTESVQFIFVSDGGQEAGPLALYTHKADGTTLPSYKMLNAIMACMKVREMATSLATIKLWDFDSNAEVEKTKDVYASLIGNPVGLVLQAEEYENRSGEIKERLIIAAPFEAATRKMAEEVLTSAPAAKALDKYLTWFTAGHQIKRMKGVRPVAKQAAQADASFGSGPGFDDDEIPFAPIARRAYW